MWVIKILNQNITHELNDEGNENLTPPLHLGDTWETLGKNLTQILPVKTERINSQKF